MKTAPLAAAAVALLFTLGAQAAAQAETLYVANGGSNTNPCSSTAPCATLNGAYQKAGPGDEIRVAAGAYPSQTISMDADKPVGEADVVIRAVGTVTLNDLTVQANDVHTVDLNVSLTGGGQPTVLGPARNVIIEGGHATNLYVTGNARNILFKGGEYGPYASCGGGSQIKTSTAGGDDPNPAAQPADITIDGAYFHDYSVPSSCPSAHLDCIHVFYHQRFTLRNTVLARCGIPPPGQPGRGFGVFLQSTGSTAVEGDLLENNIAFDSGIAGDIRLRGSDFPGQEQFDNVIVRHNTMETAAAGLGNSIYRNVIYQDNLFVTGPSCNSGVTFGGNISQNGSVCPGDVHVTDVGFVNLAGGNLHILPSSPAVNAARGAGHPALDIDGEQRDSAPDVGADEVDGIAPPPPTTTTEPPPPTTTTPPPGEYHPACEPTCDEQILTQTARADALAAQVAELQGRIDRAVAELTP